jgi:hypothetical protein
MHGRPTGLFITASHSLAPCLAFCFYQLLELPLPLQLLMVSLLSSQPLNWRLGLEEQDQGGTLARWEAISKSSLKPLSI